MVRVAKTHPKICQGGNWSIVKLCETYNVMQDYKPYTFTFLFNLPGMLFI